MFEFFVVKSGLWQSDALLPTLFNLALEKIMGEIWNFWKMEICGEQVILTYSNDIIVMEEMRD